MGINPAVAIHFKQVFWSIRGHITYLAFGYNVLNVSKAIARLIPVAKGRTNKSEIKLWPAI